MARRLTIRIIWPLITIVVLGALGWAGWTVYQAVTSLPDFSTALLTPPPVTRIYGTTQQPIAVVGTGRTDINVSLGQMPQQLLQAVLATEDIRFYENSGFDLRSYARSAWYDITHRRLAQGGSTITEQLANNVFLKNNHQSSFKRKIQQFILGLEITHRYTKDEILQMYLNKIYFGSGAYGVGAASQTYFGVNPNKLDLPQAALLAGLPQSPSYYSPLTNPNAALDRRNQVLANMLRYKFISQSAYDKAVKTGLELHPNRSMGSSAYPYATDYILQQLEKLKLSDKAYQGGINVYTTIDPKVQDALQKALANSKNFPATKVDKNGLHEPEAAAVFMDQHTGGIVAIAGGREHNTNMPLNRAVQSYRQPGSSIKPFIDYGPAIEDLHLTPNTLVDDTPLTIGNYSPQNDDHKYLGPVTLRYGLTMSINVVAVRLLDMVGIPKAAQFAAGCGITVNPKDGLAMALGGMSHGVSPLEMAGAYAAIANGGVYIQPHVITKVVTQSGLDLYTAAPRTHTAMSGYTDWALTSMLQSVVQEGTGTAAAIPSWPVAGKTGTSTGGRDLWFDGFTPVLTGSVWIGYDSSKDTWGYGGSYAAPIWRQVMTAALDGRSPEQFKVPPGVYLTAPEDAAPPPETTSTPGNTGQGTTATQTPGGTNTNQGTGTNQGTAPASPGKAGAGPGNGKVAPSGPTAFQPGAKGDEALAHSA